MHVRMLGICKGNVQMLIHPCTLVAPDIFQTVSCTDLQPLLSLQKTLAVLPGRQDSNFPPPEMRGCHLVPGLPS